MPLSTPPLGPKEDVCVYPRSWTQAQKACPAGPRFEDRKPCFPETFRGWCLGFVGCGVIFWVFGGLRAAAERKDTDFFLRKQDPFSMLCPAGSGHRLESHEWCA